jgi:hypothetical protein
VILNLSSFCKEDEGAIRNALEELKKCTARYFLFDAGDLRGMEFDYVEFVSE